ncbi:signal recognition particle-docking protein FtsY [Myxosarcina sp. GI1]|uniref:signal recognition particle-docking protein FtsY n=1 Tax=Myxosarcina sp. GI1 TaxID=1541065 RepID=UPI00055CCA7F|nr:signal recognition particle-docking protein FtsY [Myxosarcina sp. GI1]
MFNWFRRNEKASKSKSKPDREVPAKDTPAAPNKTVAESETSTSQVDYLAYAKAAYQNIQQRKEQQEETKTVAEAKKTESLEAETEIADTNTETTATPQQPISEPEVQPQLDEVEASSTSAENVPVWMRKSQGLEKLKATAIETPEPETKPEASSTVKEEIDEDFIWSAKVLADRGRTAEDVSEEEISWLTKLRQGLGKTRRGLVDSLKAVVGKGPLNDDAVMEIESLLLQADVGIEATDYIIETLQKKLREETPPPEQAIAYLKSILQDILDKPLAGTEDTAFVPEQGKLNIWLLTGVNGAGKTTTIGKLANLGQKSGYSCLIAAADTFRAAAVEQVKVWGGRSNTPVVANPGKNTDPAAVVYDAIAAATSRNTELLLVDTAGRLQNKQNLMAELSKIRKIIDKKAPNAIVESLLVLDATLGQNGLRQAQVFSEAARLSGVVLTKLDGSAKGGVALAVTQQLNLPIRFIGAGEGIEDLRPFSSYEFVEALLNG